MLTLDNFWISQFEVKNNRLHSGSVISEKNSSPNGRTTSCTEWYLITTFYYTDGSSTQTQEYLGTTCTGSGEGSGCNGNPGEPQVPCGDNGGEGGEATEVKDETFTGGQSVLDPSGSGYLIPITYEAEADAIIHKWTRIILNVTCYKPRPYPASQMFVDSNGSLATAAVSVGDWRVSRFPLLGGWSAHILWTFETIWNFTYSTGVITNSFPNNGMSKVIGPYL
jgi:hypothetical protein